MSGSKQVRAKLAALVAAGLLAASCSGGSNDDSTGKAKAGKGKAGSVSPATIAVSPITGSHDVSPIAPIVIKAHNGVLDDVQVRSSDGKLVRGARSADRTAWRTREPLAYGRTYSVTATGHNTDNERTTTRSTFATVAPSAIGEFATVPEPERKTVGIGQPVTLVFDEPVTNKALVERSLIVTTTPGTVGFWHWVGDKEVRWRPRDYWKPGTKVTVDINLFGKKLADGTYGKANQRLDFSIHDSWVAKGDVNAHTLAIYHNGRHVTTFPASFGRPKYPTHDGVHVVQEKHQLFMMNSDSYGLPASSPDGYSNFPAYWASRISWGGEFVHANDGTTYAHGVENVSHGCINLTSERAKWFYDHFNTGDLVVISGGTPMLEVWDGFGDWNMSWDQVRKGSALR